MATPSSKEALMAELDRVVRDTLAYFDGAGRVTAARVDRWQARDVLMHFYLFPRRDRVGPAVRGARRPALALADGRRRDQRGVPAAARARELRRALDPAPPGARAARARRAQRPRYRQAVLSPPQRRTGERPAAARGADPALGRARARPSGGGQVDGVSRLLASVVAVAPAAADHGGPLRDAPMSPLTAAIVFAGLALLVGAVVLVLIRVLTRQR